MLISVVVPVYNTKPYISKCLNSILNQTYKKIEILVINDCSSDGVEKTLKKYENQDNRIKVFHFKKNKGVSYARNYAVKKSKGKFITFVDSDDYIEKNMIMNMVKKQQINNSEIVKCNHFTIINNNKKYKFGVSITSDIQKKYMLSIPMIQGQLISKSIAQNSPFPDNNIFYEDLATIPAFALETNKIVFLEDSSYNYVQRTNSTMHQSEFNVKFFDIFAALEILRNRFRIVQKHKQYFQEIEYLHIQHLLYRTSLRFFRYGNYSENIKKINDTMLKLYPKWYNNLYYKQYMNFKKRMFCTLVYFNLFKVAKLLMRRRIYE